MGVCGDANWTVVFVMKYAIEEIQAELEKRLPYKYQWQQKQNDIWDSHTALIYETLQWETLLERMKQAITAENFNKKALFDYAANRWFNFWSSVGVEQVFSELKAVEKVTNSKDSEKDFYLKGIPFDHETSVFPKRFKKGLSYVLRHKRELILGFYEHQSQQKRYHLKNRLFLTVHPSDGAHWKLKANVLKLKTEVIKYVNNFSEAQLQNLIFANGDTALSDIIWIQE